MKISQARYNIQNSLLLIAIWDTGRANHYDFIGWCVSIRILSIVVQENYEVLSMQPAIHFQNLPKPWAFSADGDEETNLPTPIRECSCGGFMTSGVVSHMEMN